MKPVYLVTESYTNTEILKRLLPTELVQRTEFVTARGRYSASSLSGTILSERMRPVALVINANTTSSGAIQEQANTITSLLLPASSGVPYKVFMAVPTVEAILEQVKTDLETRLAHPPVTSVLNSLNAGQIQILQQQSLIQQITQFLVNVLSLAA